jgi:hypothetical protein
VIRPPNPRQIARQSRRFAKREDLITLAVLPDRTYMEWEASAFGLPISRVTVLTIDSEGRLVRIALHHRPRGAVERFSAEFGEPLPRS